MALYAGHFSLVETKGNEFVIEHYQKGLTRNKSALDSSGK